MKRRKKIDTWCLMFIDLERAYEKVPRNVLWWVLKKKGIYINAITDMYERALYYENTGR